MTPLERAVKEGLYIIYDAGLYPKYWLPVSYTETEVKLQDADCGLIKPLLSMTHESFNECAGQNGEYLYRKVGFYEFSDANLSAIEEICQAHNDPDWAGTRIAELEAENARLRAQLAAQPGACKACRHWGRP